MRPASEFVLTPDSDDMREAANACAERTRSEIAIEREIREIRKKKLVADFVRDRKGGTSTPQKKFTPITK